MDHRHLWLRSRRQHAVLKVRHTVVQAVRNFLDNDGFTLCDSPIFTPCCVRERRRCSRSITSTVRRRISPNQVSSTTKRLPRRLAKSTALVPRSGRKSRRRDGI